MRIFRRATDWSLLRATAVCALLATSVSAQLDADFTASSTSGTNPLTVQFTDATTGGIPVNWTWQFGDGQIFSGQHATHTYAVPGTYTVTLNVFGKGLVFDSEVKRDFITVDPATFAPAIIADPESGTNPLTISFQDATTGTDPTAWLWDFGDGATSANQNPVHTYTAPGTYTVSLTAFVGEQFESVVEPDLIHVSPAELEAGFTADPVKGINPLSVQFTDNSTGVTPSTWLWDFGDGASAEEPNPSHTYLAPGQYSVSLTVFVEEQSDVIEEVDLISVRPAPVDVDFTADPVSGVDPLTVSFTNLTTGTAPTAWLWAFGDGEASTEQDPEHKYKEPGTYTVTLTAYVGEQAEGVFKPDLITVAPAPPPALELLNVFGSGLTNFGERLDGIGDVDGDGVPDFAVASSRDDTIASDAGRVRVYSSADGATLCTFYGEAEDDHFGDDIAGLGDIDGDGHADFAVGAPNSFSNPQANGYVKVLSCVDGRLIKKLVGATLGDRFGQTIDGGGDFNGDGVRDLAVASAQADTQGLTNNGHVDVFSGTDLDVVLGAFDGTSESDFYGANQIRLNGDINADGFGDLMISAPGSNRLDIRSGFDGSVLREHHGPAESQFPKGADFLGDVDGDGVVDYAATTWDNAAQPQVQVFSGAEGGELYRVVPGIASAYGYAIAGPGDLDRDGIPDFVLSDIWINCGGFTEDCGLVYAYSGQDGRLIFTIQGEFNEQKLGYDLAAIGDLTGDGMNEFLCGATGQATVYQPDSPAWTVVDGAIEGSNGLPILTPTGALSAGAHGRLTVTAARPHTLASLVFSLVELGVPFKGGTLVPAPESVLVFPTGPEGLRHLPFSVPRSVPSGLDVFVQVWIPDDAAPQGLAATNGLKGKTY